MKCIFIYNPKSGKQQIKKNIDYIEKRLKSKFKEVRIYETKSQQDLIDTAAASCDIYDAIFFSGGDGAFNNIIQGVMQKENRPPLGYIPAGTVCDIGRNIGSSKKIKKALDIMLDGDIITYDVGLSNGKYFVYTCSTGTFVSTSYQTSSKLKAKFGKFAYYIAGILEFFKPTIKTIEFNHNGRIVKIKTPLLLIINSRSVGGFPVNKRAKINSGKFHIYVIKNSNNRISGAINVIRFYLRGFLGLKLTPVAHCITDTEFKVVSNDNILWCLDGEEGPKNNIEVKYIPNAFKLYINPKMAERFAKK